MKNYYYLDFQNKQVGPIPLEELKQVGIRPDTKVWYQGAANWMSAIEVDELRILFPPGSYPNNTGAPFNGQSSNYGNTQPHTLPNSNVKPDNWLIWSIVVTILCCIPTGILAILESTKVDKLWACGDYEGANNSVKKAKTYVFISIGVGFVAFIISFIFGFMSSLL